MNVAIVIPARYASERFPGKPLALIDGVPMIVRVWRNMRESQRAASVIVATDDERIAQAVRDAGGRVVITDPQLPSGSDRVWAAIKAEPFDVVVNVQGDEPLLAAAAVDSLIDALERSPGHDIATLVVAQPRHRARSADEVTVAVDESGTALYFSRETIPHGADPVWRHVGVYAYRKGALERFVAAPPAVLEQAERLEQLRALALQLRILAVPAEVVLQAVDRPADVARVEQLLRGGKPAVDIALVALDADGVLTDGSIAYLPSGEQLVTFDVKDGHGIKELQLRGIAVAVVSGRDSPALRLRCRELGIEHLRLGVTDKRAELADLCEQLGIRPDQVCFVGDDLPDLAAFAFCGLSAAPSDAVAEVRAAAAIALRAPGGRGAVRELADRLLALVTAQPPD